MKALHTPGPWEVKHSESKPAFNVVGTKLGGKYKIARCPYISKDGLAYDKEQVEANARLIAAAPELLDACERALLYLHTKYPKEADIFNELKSAIAKAIGEKEPQL